MKGYDKHSVKVADKTFSAEAEVIVMDSRVHIPSSGIPVRILGVAQWALDNLRSAVVYPDVPTYDIETVSGAIEKAPHNETTLTTDEDKAAWAAYKAEYAKADADLRERLTKLALMKGIDVDYDENGEWAELQEFIGMSVPPVDKKLERRLHYIKTEVIKTPSDINAIMEKVMLASEVNQEVLDQAKQSFQNPVEGRQELDGDAKA